MCTHRTSEAATLMRLSARVAEPPAVFLCGSQWLHAAKDDTLAAGVAGAASLSDFRRFSAVAHIQGCQLCVARPGSPNHKDRPSSPGRAQAMQTPCKGRGPLKAIGFFSPRIQPSLHKALVGGSHQRRLYCNDHGSNIVPWSDKKQRQAKRCSKQHVRVRKLLTAWQLLSSKGLSP